MSKTFWAVIAIIVVVFGGILLFNGKDANAPTGSKSNAKASEHIKGEGGAGLTLVEYGDFQCPYCGKFYPAVSQAVQKYQGDIKFQFRHLPLIQAHKNAFGAARAAEAASLQGKFWEMYDMLYQNQTVWSESDQAQSIFDQYASRMNLDLAKFKKDFASSAVANTINADVAAFNKTGVEKSTPTFFLNGKKVQPAGYTLEDFSRILDPAIAEAKKKSGDNQ